MAGGVSGRGRFDRFLAAATAASRSRSDLRRQRVAEMEAAAVSCKSGNRRLRPRRGRCNHATMSLIALVMFGVDEGPED
ncbi:hypothetical protein AKJ16_DCAP06079 [Drosera capensis]